MTSSPPHETIIINNLLKSWQATFVTS